MIKRRRVGLTKRSRSRRRKHRRIVRKDALRNRYAEERELIELKLLDIGGEAG